MNTKGNVRKSFAVLSALLLMVITLFAGVPVRAGAEETQPLVTNYADLWTSTDIAVKAGVPVKWYVTVPEDTEPKGCGATIKIPGLGFGTDTHNKDEGHIVLQKGENFIYEFTPEKTGDILFTCWMGSGCHSNYIHVTEDGTYNVPKPADPTEISAVREGEKTVVSFKAPEAPAGSTIIGYTVTAAAEDGTRKKATVTESPAVLEGLDASKEYTIVVVTKGTSGKSTGENSFVLKAADAESKDTADNDTGSTGNGNGNDSLAESGSSDPTGSTSGSSSDSEQIIVTEYSGLWSGNISVKAGVPVKWYVNVPEGTALNGCAKTIKIPGLGWGTDTHNKDEGHLTLVTGRNFVYAFTPDETGDILFTCWMGSGCHYNYIHVTADGKTDSNAAAGGGDNHSHSDDETEKAADTDSKTGTSSDSKADTSSDGSTDVKADDTSAAKDSSSDDPDGGAGTGSGAGSGSGSGAGSGSGSGSASSTFAGAKVAEENNSGTAADSGSSAAPQVTAGSTDPNANPHTGDNTLPGFGSIAILIFLTAASAADKKRKHSENNKRSNEK